MNFKRISQLNIQDLLADEEFILTYTALYNASSGTNDGMVIYARETSFLKQLYLKDAGLRKCTTLSVAASLLDGAYHDLSIEPITKPLAYLLNKGHNIGTKAAPVYEQRAYFAVTGYGEILLRIRSGFIKHADNPVIVYEGDFFQVVNNVPHHEQGFESSVITHAYMKITRYDGTVDYKVFPMSQIQTYRGASDNKSSVAWTGGVDGQPTIGMIEAKVIKHSFSTYPRIKLGKNTLLLTSQADEGMIHDLYESSTSDMETIDRSEQYQESEEGGVPEENPSTSEIGEGFDQAVVDDSTVTDFDFS